MLSQPGFDRRDFTIGQEGYNPPPLEITDNRPITMIPAESKIIDPNYDERLNSRAGSASDDAQQGVIADGQHQSPREARRRPAAKHEAQMMNDAIQPRRSPGMACENSPVEAFGEKSAADNFQTEEAAREHAQGHTATSAGQTAPCRI